MAGQNTVTFNEQNFQQEVIDARGTVLVDFWAEWCGPCVAFGPTLDGVADETAGRVTVGKLNVDDARPIARQHEIRSIPTVLVFRDGEVVDRLVGMQSRESLLEAIEKAETANV